MSNPSMPKEKKYDLEERTAVFGENVILLCKKIPLTSITIPLENQLIKSSTSVGANYCEADDAESKKEARESKHFLRMLKIVFIKNNSLVMEAQSLHQEAKEINLIFNIIYKKVGK